MRFWVGGYGTDAGGTATGIGVLEAGDADSPFAGGPLALTGVAAAAESPSWVTRHPSQDVVYAALEKRGDVRAYRRTGGQGLVPIGPAVAAGELACHVAVAPSGRFLIASCWGDGRVVRIPLDAEGGLGRASIAPAAVDPHGSGARGGASEADGPAEGPDAADDTDAGDAADDRDRDIDLAAAARALRAAAGEEFAHLVPDYDAAAPSEVTVDALEEAVAADAAPRVSRAHQARFLPGGVVVTTDMGFDLVRIWRTDGAGLRAAEEVVFPRGSGPRHTVWHPSGHLYVVTELSLEVFVLAPDGAGRWRILSATPLGQGTLPGDTAAEIALAHDRAFVYGGVRGSDTLATLRVAGDGSTLVPVAIDDAGVENPRHHVVVRDTLLVAGRRSDDVVSRTLDIRSGVPGRVRRRAAVPSPTCLLPFS